MQIALHTQLKPGYEADYEELHRTIPDRLAKALTTAGVSDWRIWRDGVHLFHLVDVDDYQAMRRALADDPVNAEWQAQVNPLLDQPDDYSGDRTVLGFVWSLAKQCEGVPGR